MPILDPKLQKIVNETINFIEDHNGLLKSQVKKMQLELIKRLLVELVPKMEIEDGVIKNSMKNIRILENLNKTFTQFDLAVGANTTSTFVAGFYQLNLFENKYYMTLNKAGADFKKKLFETVLKETEKKMMYRLGIIEGSTKYRTGSFLEGFVSDKTILNEVRDYVLKSVGSQKSVVDFGEGLKGLIDGVNENQGLFERYYQQYAYDTYSEYNNTYAEQLAAGLDLQCFIYTGGLIDKSRPFCEEHNDKVFTRNEVTDIDKESAWVNWVDPKTGEPPTYIASFPGYDPLVNLGGWNCRHKLSWITNEMAIEERPEIAELLNE